jgi:hypothetical protein
MSGRHHLDGDIHDGRNRRDPGCSTNALYIVDAVLKADHDSLAFEMRRYASGRIFRIERFYAKQHDIRITCGGGLG